MPFLKQPLNLLFLCHKSATTCQIDSYKVSNSNLKPDLRNCVKTEMIESMASLTPKDIVWKWRQNWTLKIDIPTLNAPISTKKVFIFKLTIENYCKNYSGLIRSKFLSLSPMKSVAFCSVASGRKLPKKKRDIGTNL